MILTSTAYRFAGANGLLCPSLKDEDYVTVKKSPIDFAFTGRNM